MDVADGRVGRERPRCARSLLNAEEIREGKKVGDLKCEPKKYLAGVLMMVISVVSIVEVRRFFCTKYLQDFFRGGRGEQFFPEFFLIHQA